MLKRLLVFLTARNVAGLIFLFCIAGLLFALFMQYVIGVQPCPLCVTQRMELIFVGVLAAFGFFFGRWRPVLQISLFFAAFFSMIGIATASWQIYIQANPPEFVDCGPGIDYMLANFPLYEAVPMIFSPNSECTIAAYIIPGILTIPQLSLMGFIAALLMATYGFYRTIMPYQKAIFR